MWHPWVLIAVLAWAAPAAGAKPRPARLTVEAPVDGASVEVDGKVVGKTPLAPISVAPGKHTVKVKKLGYLEHVEAVDARAGATVRVDADLLPFAGVLRVAANAPGAQVAVDGKIVGRAPCEVEVKLGKRVVTVSAPGYRESVQTLSVSAGNSYEVDARLEKLAAGGDDLDLVPLAPGRPAAAPAPAASPTQKPADGPRGAGDDLDLEPLVIPELAPIGPSPAAPRPLAEPPPRPGFVTPPPMVATSEPPPSDVWYRRPWVWGGAAAIVVAAGGATWALTRRGGSTSCHDTWVLGQSSSFDPRACPR